MKNHIVVTGRILAICLTLVMVWVGLAQAACPVFSTGTFIEAEDRNASGDFSSHYDGDASGNRYLDANNNNQPASYQVNFPETGIWYLWVLGETRGNDDKLDYGLDSTKLGTTDFPNDNGYNWSKAGNGNPNPTRISITSTGNHTVNFWGNKHDYDLRFDGFFLTKDSSFTPSGSSSPFGGTAIDPSAGDCGGNVPVDADNDGYYNNNDCDDNNAAVNPGVTEVCGNSVDDNCNGSVDENCTVDNDGDGSDATADCNDNDASIYPGASEICNDLVDNNCNGQVDEGCDPDFDGDGYPASTDCDDSRSDINPGATEICDGFDNDCDGSIDPSCDLDSDGYDNTTDCNDGDPLINPGAVEDCSDLLDNNCDGQINEGCSSGSGGGSGDISQMPLFLSQGAPPLNLLVLGRDHKLFYEAYNDASDLNDDGNLDVRFKPNLTYYGYFDSGKCYAYSNSNHRFEPTAVVADATLKTCTGLTEWSGNWLNYVTTSRMDALRKVLYGGYRSTDSATTTVLERSHVPQDAHSWGREYYSQGIDGYDIRDYTPLNLPSNDTRHLFANVSLGDAVTGTAPNAPLLRVLDNSTYRIWEWISIERPVAGTKCVHGSSGPDCAHSGGTVWDIVPSEAFQSLTMTTYDASSQGSHPNNLTEFRTFITNVQNNTSGPQGSGTVANINGSGNPWGSDEYYLTIFNGTLQVDTAANYTFGVDGDDAVAVIIDGTEVAGWYGGHGNDASLLSSHSGTVFLTAGSHSIEFLHEELTGGDSYYLYYQRTVPTSTMTDYEVRTQVCVSGLLEDNCQIYPSGVAKPIGLLQQYGEDNSMKFGLLTGSYHKNTSGGVLRKTVGSISDEINASTGQFSSTVGIVKTIDRLRTVGFMNNYEYPESDDCGWITNGPITEGHCRMWGNPIGEMMYEGLRYFAGFGSPLSTFSIPSTGTDDYGLNLPLATWNDPYASGNNEVCARPFQLVISDINPSYDTDQLPGANSNFGSVSSASINGQSLDVESEADAIWDHEFGSGTTQDVFIGQSGNTSDYSPSAKTVSSFGNIRGLSPEEPTKQGGYYSASIAHFGQTHDISAASDVQNMSVFSVALASPLPRIDIPVAGKKLTLVPFAKSVAGSSISSTQGNFQPTNQIVDFYVETLTPTYGKFRINYEDVEQGADHDMDAIVEYIYQVNGDNTVTVTLNSVYAAGGIAQHMGYVMSGSTADGIYLEVRDCDTANPSGTGTCSGDNPSTDPDYFLDTPPGQPPSGDWYDSLPLPLSNSRTFTPASSVSVGTTADFLENPLWYAAKYGMFDDLNGNDMPDSGEWDNDPDIGGDGTPDNYFKVTNALNLGPQLAKAFEQILGTSSSASAIATNSTRLDTDTLVYQARFNSDDWSGDLKAYPVLSDGTVGSEQWDAAGQILPANASTREVFTWRPDTSTGVTFVEANLSTAQVGYLDKRADGTVDGLATERIAYLRGADSYEEKNGGTFRDRDNLLGDIINSDPWFVGTQDYGYSSIAGTEGTDYVTYHNNLLTTGRTPTLYVGANDGMLHAFNADTYANGGGSELFAYIPSFVMPYLNHLTLPAYDHRYFVDGSPRATDAYLDLDGDTVPEWHTILVGTAGAGGKGIFALDVTDPSSFGTSNILWEITSSTTGFGNLGYGINQQPFIVRLRTGQWVAVFGNGYESATGKAVIYVVDLKTGTKLFEFDCQVGDTTTLNGMSGVTPVDFEGDRSIDALYAGDLQGNLWKVDLTASNSASWDFDYKNGSTPAPLFIARGPSGNVQSITTRPEVGKGPAGNATEVMVYFGTGSYYKVSDNSVSASPPVESMYGILDKRTNNSQITATDRSVLQQQTIDAETSAFGFSLRVVSNNTIDWTTKRGWYLNLISPGASANGERVIDTPILIGTNLVFTTLIPSGSDCDFGGTGWLMEINPLSGSRINSTVFDLNNDGSFTSADEVTVTINGVDVTVPVSGKRSNDGIITTPGIISAGDKEFKLSSTSSGTIETTVEKSSSPNKGRGSWRQLR